MRFIKTRNNISNIQEKKPVLGLELTGVQFKIYSSLGFFAFMVFTFFNMSTFVKIIFLALLFILAKLLAKNFEKNKYAGNGKTIYEWFKIFLRKIFSGSKMVDKGADYKYFIKK